MSVQKLIGVIFGLLGSGAWLFYQMNTEVVRIDTTQKIHMQSDKATHDELRKSINNIYED